MAIIWRDAMSVGVPVLDDDHKVLIGIINEFEAAAAKGIGPGPLSRIVKRLYDYAIVHFEREERFQVECRVPDHAAHKEEHARLLASVTQRIRAYFIDRTTPITAQTMDDLTAFLRAWLVDHIIKVDLKMRPYLAGDGH